MKKLFLFITILLSSNLVFAGGPQTISDWLGQAEAKTLGVQSKIKAYGAIIRLAKEKMQDLQNQLNSGNDPYCGYLKPNGKPTTYANMQMMQNAGAFLISPGNCSDVSDGYFPANVNSTNPSCQKITQTLWEGKNNSTTNGNMSVLFNFLIKQDPDFIFDGISDFTADGGGPIIGNYGEHVTILVKRFQSKYGIKQTGAVGPITLAKINSMICSTNKDNSGSLSCGDAGFKVCNNGTCRCEGKI